MARRLTAEEKGKGLVSEAKEPHIKRIRAPPMDTSALIEENSLTLIGRLTNPREQRMWALIPSLPRKWNTQGRVVGSDLGNNCFQFRFEKEEDLQRVLDNRPYHFGYWMVILQRWKPVISESFPSLIPFWIRIKGLPLHFWQDAMICNIGKELGTLDKHELTKTSARVRVYVNGLKPLIKESIVEYESGEESKITFEYERLESHSSKCLLLSHKSEHCPSVEAVESLKEGPPPENDLKMGEQLIEAHSDYQARNYSPRRGPERKETRRGQNDFHQRVDRHGRSFGERISTRHTRSPPPVKLIPGEQLHPTEKRKRKFRETNRLLFSPVY